MSDADGIIHDEWISVADRRPPPETEVVVYGPSGGIDIGVDIAANLGDTTHWMPMPKGVAWFLEPGVHENQYLGHVDMKPGATREQWEAAWRSLLKKRCSSCGVCLENRIAACPRCGSVDLVIREYSAAAA